MPEPKRQRRHKFGQYYGKDYFPAKILCFFSIPGDGTDEKIHALVHTCEDKTEELAHSSLLEIWKLEYEKEFCIPGDVTNSFYRTPKEYPPDQ